MLEIDRLGEDASNITDFNLHNIGHLSSCTYLNLHCNRLRSLDGLPHSSLTSLTELNLSSNDFSSGCLPELSHLPLLRILDLSANTLQRVVELPFLPGLESLIIAHNIITNLDGLNDNAPNLIKLDVRNNVLHERHDLLSVSLLPNLRELHVGGKQRSEIFTNANEVLCLFEFCSTIATIDGRSKSQWLAETTQALNTTSISNSPRHIPIPIPVPIAIFTPRFDRASRLWQNRLIEKADEERKRNEEKYLETRKADSHEMTMNLQREKSRIAGLSRGLRAISMHAVIGILNKKYRQKHEKKISGAMILNDEKAKSLELERSCLESERALDAIKRMETEQCRESERLYIKQMIEGMQAEHCSDLSKAVATAKAFYSLQVHAIKSSLGTAIEKSEVARKFIQGKYVELEVAHAEYLREAEESKIDGERERREAEEIQAALLTETTMQDTQKELILLKCRAFCYLQLHARVRKVERESNERDLKSSAALTIERRSFQDRIDLLQQDLEATRQSVKGCDLITAIAAADNAQRLNRRDEQISVLQDQLLAAKNNMQTIVERTALLRLTDERLTSEKVADSALISELRGIISGKEDAYAKREGDMLGIIEAQEQEHRQLKESHTSLRRKAERAVKRLNSVHNAFLEAVEDRDHLARMLNDFDVEKAEREATIVELGSCIRQLQTALRNLSLNLSVTQAKGQTQTPQAVKELLVQSMQGVEGGGGCIVKEEPNTDRDDDILRYCTTSSSRDGVGVCVGDEASIPEGLNESTDFLNHSSFRSAKERDGSNSDSGRSNSLELPRVECTGDGCTSDPSPCQISTPIDSAAPIYERDNSRGADIVRRRVMPRQQVMTVANGSIGTQSANTVPNTMYCCSAVNLDTLHAELDQRTLDLEDAERSVADLTQSQINLQAAFQVKVCMLADQTEIILDLREKLVKASQHREQLQDSLIEVEHLLDSSESQRKDAADNLDRKCRREMQLTSKIKSLEDVNLKLKQTVEMQSEDSSSSDSDGGIEEEEAEEEEEERSAEGEGEDEVDEGKEESVEGRIEAYIVAKHNAQAIAKRLRSRDCELGIADVAYRDGCRASSQTSHPTHLTKQTLSPSSPSSSSPSSASGLRKQLRLSSRKELKGRIVQLTASHLSLEASKKAKEDLIKAFRVTIEEQKDEILCCTTAAKEAKRELEDTAKKLLCKENENIRVAHSVIQLEGKLEQLCLKLQIEQERNSMMSEGFLNERKYLSRTVKQLQSESSSKEEDFKRLRGVTDQLRLLVASGSLHN